MSARRTLTVNQPRRKPRPDPYTHPRCPSVDPEYPSVRCLLDAGHHTDRHFAGGREWVDTPTEDVA